MSARHGLRPYLLVLGAAACWGTIGVAYALILDGVAIHPVTLVTLRAAVAFGLLLAFGLVARRDLLRVRARDLPFLALFGLITISVFYVALIYAFALTGVAVGTVLLYLAPAFVTGAAALFLGERITRRKALALGLCLLGAALVVEPWRGAGGASWGGIALGVLSALTYGAQSLLGKPALRRHHPLTLLVYALGFGLLGLLPVQLAVGSTLPGGRALLLIAAVAGVLITLLPLGLYTLALRELPSSTASIVATLEPAVAIALAAGVLGQFLRPPQLLGAALILGGVCALAAGEGRTRPPLRGQAPEHRTGGQEAEGGGREAVEASGKG